MSELEKIDPRVLGGRIADFRKACGKTQEETATYLGMSRPTYIATEKGTRRPTSTVSLTTTTTSSRTTYRPSRPRG